MTLINSKQEIDIDWIARRCRALHGKNLDISTRQLDAIHRSVKQQSGCDQTQYFQKIIKKLFEALEIDAPEWSEEPSIEKLPMIALLPGRGCLIAYGRTSQGGWLLEGAKGCEQLDLIPEKSLFSPITGSVANSPENSKAFGVFREALTSRKTIFIHSGIASCLCNVFALVTSLYSLQVYDRVIPTKGLQTLTVLTIGVGIVLTIDFVIKMTRSNLLENFIKGADLEISQKIFNRLLEVRMDQFPASVGTLSSQVRSYEVIRSFASSATLYMIIDAPFAILFVLVIMGIAGPLVAFVAIAFFILSLALGLIFKRKIENHTMNSAAFSNMKLGLLVETVSGAESIKSAGAGWQMLTRWNRLNRQAVNDDAQTRHYTETSSYLAGFMQQTSYILLVGTGAYIASTTNDLTTGGIIACSILSGRVLAPISMLPGLIVQWGHAKIALKNLERVYALERDNHAVSRPIRPTILQGSYLLTKVRFAYHGRPETVAIDRLSIEPGEKVGILGGIGAGKSTLLKLLAGLYRPQHGQILLDALDLQHISRHTLSERLGYLPQNIHLFSGSIRDNLLLGLSDIEEAEILNACNKTGLIDLIRSHPKGLDLEITEGGAGVSGGQKQLIGITRLMLSKPDIWLLDEPTASMDERYEYFALSGLQQEISKKQTLVLVTHKPKLLSLVNRLVVITPEGVAIDGPRDIVINKLMQNSSTAHNQDKSRGTNQ